MAEEPIQLLRRGSIGWLTLNRPDSLNSMNDALMDMLRSSLMALAEDSEVRCVVIRGSGRAFSSGGDLRMMAERRRVSAEYPSTGAEIQQHTQLLRRRSEAVELLQQMPKPTIAALHGHVVGGALGLALSADVRIAAASTRLRIGFSSVALSGDYGVSYLLCQAVGPTRARELLLLDPAISAAEAKAWGLVTFVEPDDQLEAATSQLAQKLSEGPTVAYSRIKANLWAAQDTLAHSLDAEAMNQRVCAMTADAAEAGRAREEGRSPAFRGT